MEGFFCFSFRGTWGLGTDGKVEPLGLVTDEKVEPWGLDKEEKVEPPGSSDLWEGGTLRSRYGEGETLGSSDWWEGN